MLAADNKGAPRGCSRLGSGADADGSVPAVLVATLVSVGAESLVASDTLASTLAGAVSDEREDGVGVSVWDDAEASAAGGHAGASAAGTRVLP